MSMLKKVKEVLNTKIYYMYRLKDNTVKVAILPQLIRVYIQDNSNQNPPGFFVDINMLFLKHMERQGIGFAKTNFEKNKLDNSYYPILRNTIKLL